jgi:hypothetical protein
MTKIAGSGFISQRHRFTDPDPHQNVMDPKHGKIDSVFNDFLNKNITGRHVNTVTFYFN